MTFSLFSGFGRVFGSPQIAFYSWRFHQIEGQAAAFCQALVALDQCAFVISKYERFACNAEGRIERNDVRLTALFWVSVCEKLIAERGLCSK